MPTFFLGWRRKIGVMTLVMACVVTLACIRSYFLWDHISIFSGAFEIDSRAGAFDFKTYFLPRDGFPPYFIEWTVRPIEVTGRVPEYIDYWHVVALLTFVSAWFLFYKPRPKKPPESN